MNIQTFIFNWRNQYNKTKEKEKQLNDIGISPIVINSDDDNKEKNWINIGEESYFSAQFLSALDIFDADVLFHIQADVSYDNWEIIYKNAKKYFLEYNWGIYAPNVDYTWYDREKVDLNYFKYPGTALKMVATTDCTCWMIHKDIINKAIDRNIDFSPYKFGWSFDLVYPALSFINKRPVLRDYSITMDHPVGTNYNKQLAEEEMMQLYHTLDSDVKEAFYYIKSDPAKLTKYYLNV